MHDSKPNPARPSFWCGVLTAEKQAVTPSRARLVRGHCTSFTPGTPASVRPAPAGESDDGREKS